MAEENCPKVFMKIHRERSEVLVALCDRETLGRTFREGELRMRVNERFYRGTLMDVDDCDPYLREATMANFVGKESVGKGIRLGLIKEENIIRIQGVPHAQMVRVFL